MPTQDVKLASSSTVRPYGPALLLDFFTGRGYRGKTRETADPPQVVLVETLPDEGKGMTLAFALQDCACE